MFMRKNDPRAKFLKKQPSKIISNDKSKLLKSNDNRGVDIDNNLTKEIVNKKKEVLPNKKEQREQSEIDRTIDKLLTTKDVEKSASTNNDSILTSLAKLVVMIFLLLISMSMTLGLGKIAIELISKKLDDNIKMIQNDVPNVDAIKDTNVPMETSVTIDDNISTAKERREGYDPYFDNPANCKIVDKIKETGAYNTKYVLVFNCTKSEGEMKVMEYGVDLKTFYNVEVGQVLEVVNE